MRSQGRSVAGRVHSVRRQRELRAAVLERLVRGRAKGTARGTLRVIRLSSATERVGAEWSKTSRSVGDHDVASPSWRSRRRASSSHPTPDSNASGAKVIAYFVKHSNKRAANISAVLTDLAVVFGLFFFGYLRDRLRRTEVGSRLAPIAFGGAVIFAAGGLLTSGTTIALTDVPKDLTPLPRRP